MRSLQVMYHHQCTWCKMWSLTINEVRDIFCFIIFSISMHLYLYLIYVCICIDLHLYLYTRCKSWLVTISEDTLGWIINSNGPLRLFLPWFIWNIMKYFCHHRHNHRQTVEYFQIANDFDTLLGSLVFMSPVKYVLFGFIPANNLTYQDFKQLTN